MREDLEAYSVGAKHRAVNRWAARYLEIVGEDQDFSMEVAFLNDFCMGHDVPFPPLRMNFPASPCYVSEHRVPFGWWMYHDISEENPLAEEQRDEDAERGDHSTVSAELSATLDRKTEGKICDSGKWRESEEEDTKL